MIFNFRPIQSIPEDEMRVLRDFGLAVLNACEEVNCKQCIFRTWCEEHQNNLPDTLSDILRQFDIDIED